MWLCGFGHIFHPIYISEFRLYITSLYFAAQHDIYSCWMHMFICIFYMSLMRFIAISNILSYEFKEIKTHLSLNVG